MVNVGDMTRVIQLKEQRKPAKHVAFDPSGSFLAVSCSDGVVLVYSVSSEQPVVAQRINGMIKVLETDAEASAAVMWHPDGRAFAVPTATRGNSLAHA